MEKRHIVAYTDGSARGNPGPGGWGVVLWYTDDTILELGGRDDHTTNNQMELMAAIRALQGAGKALADMRIYTDSKYVKEGITSWVTGWQKNGWKTKNKEDVLNKELWMSLVDAVEARKKHGEIEWILLPGHSGTPGNERADKIATEFADKRQGMLYSGSFGSYMVDVAEPDPEVIKEQAEKRSAQRARSNAKAYSYLSLLDGKAARHTTWVECEARVKGKPAKFKKALSAEEEKEILDEWGVSL
jgi:ribonuclease HI